MKRALSYVLPKPAYNLARELYRLSKKSYMLYDYHRYWQRQEERFRTLSPAALQEAQWQRFKAILTYTYEKIPFYRERYREAGVHPDDVRSTTDLVRLPTLTKDDIRRNFPDRLLNSAKKLSPSRIGQTSGSTSESLFFVRADRNWRRSLYYSIFLRTGGIRNLPIFTFTTPHCTPASCSLRDEDRDRNRISRLLYRVPPLRHLGGMIGLPAPTTNVLCAPDDYFAGLVETLSHFSACIMIADPVYLGALARYLKRTAPDQPGRKLPEVKAIITTYELLTGSLQDLLQEVFDCEVHIQYGASEIGDVSNECEHHRSHIRSDMVLVEAIRDGRPAAPGEKGKAIITDLYNYNMPFIRYDIGDVITIGQNGCPCGRNNDTIESIGGRTFDLLALRDRGPTTPLEADEIFRGLPGIAAYRLVQEETDRFHVSVMKDADAEAFDSAQLYARCQALLGTESEIEIELREEIPPEASNKFRFVYSSLPGPSL